MRGADPPPPVAAAFPWGFWVAASWLAGSALWAAWVAAHVVRFQRIFRLARRAPEPLRAEAQALARRMGLQRCPEVWLVPGAVSPMIWALGRRPCLLFPSGLLGQLDDAGRSALLAHELAHVRRRDHWVRLLELAATGLYWWHPALWWARRELHEAEEQCCDAWGVWAMGGDGRPYALALLQAVAFVSYARLPLPAGASGVGQVSHLKRRLTMIMQGKTSRSLSWAGLGAVLGLGLLLPLFPARGQDSRPPATGTIDSRDQQIEVLKAAIKVLEEQKRREEPAADRLSRRINVNTNRNGAADTNDPASDDKHAALHAEIEEVDRAIAVKAKELRDLQQRAQALRDKLKDPNPRPSEQPGRGFGRTPPGGAPRQPAGRVEDLEKKLDRLQQELEELRRELRPGRMAPPEREPRNPGQQPLGQPQGLAPPGGIPAGPGALPPQPGGIPPGPGGLPSLPGEAPTGGTLPSGAPPSVDTVPSGATAPAGTGLPR